VQHSSISRITQFRYFYRFIEILCFASAAFFAPVVPSCIRYPAVPVCKKCAKMCRAKINPLKQALSFYVKPEKWPGSSPIRQLRYYLFRPSIKCTSTTTIHGRDLDNRIDTILYKRSFTMNKLLSCRYNMDTNRIEAQFADSSAVAIDCIAIEDEYGNTPAQRAELDWLLYNKPLEYAQLVLSGEMEHYLSLGCEHGRLED
jgi:hypothetical protein